MAMTPNLIFPEKKFELFDDFHFINTSLWTSVDDGATGTNTANSVLGGEVSIVTAGAADDYHGLKTPSVFQFAAGKPLRFEARVGFPEANTNNAGFAVGLTDTTTAGFLQNSNGAPVSSYTGAMFYVQGGTLLLKFRSSKTTTSVDSGTLATIVAGQYYRLGFDWEPWSSTLGYLKPFVYDETAGTYTNTDGKATDGLKQKFVPATTALLAFLSVKAGSSSAETLKVDYVSVQQHR